MLIAGAKRHAIEVLELFHHLDQLENLYFFDDLTISDGSLVFNKFPIIKNLVDVHNYFSTNPHFVLGLGNPLLRKKLAEKLISEGGKLTSIISDNANIGHYNVHLGIGLNVMQNAMISNSVKIGNASLINAFVSIHHDATVGEYCEVSPHATLLGGCSIGAYTSIGSNATILPNIKIGNNVIIGAGAVVTTNIPDNVIAYGVPAKIISTFNR